MNLNTLKQFRQEVYDCFDRAKDALFNTVDARLPEDRARSFPELSLSPHFERHWPSLYEGLEDGKIDQKGLQEVFARFLPQSHVQELVWVGLDVSGIPRPRAPTSADRSALYVHKRHRAFRSFARPHPCLNLFQCDRLTSFFIAYRSCCGTS
jgi:hypothetical protein